MGEHFSMMKTRWKFYFHQSAKIVPQNKIFMVDNVLFYYRKPEWLHGIQREAFNFFRCQLGKHFIAGGSNGYLDLP